jgi:hypothetical protein
LIFCVIFSSSKKNSSLNSVACTIQPNKNRWNMSHTKNLSTQKRLGYLLHIIDSNSHITSRSVWLLHKIFTYLIVWLHITRSEDSNTRMSCASIVKSCWIIIRSSSIFSSGSLIYFLNIETWNTGCTSAIVWHPTLNQRWLVLTRIITGCYYWSNNV